MPDPAKYGVFHYPLTATAVTPQSRLELSESASCHVWSVGLTRGVIPSHPFTQPCDPSVVVLPSRSLIVGDVKVIALLGGWKGGWTAPVLGRWLGHFYIILLLRILELGLG